MSTVMNSARRTAGRARRSNVLEVLTRVGFIGYGLLHLAVAWLALQIALGHPSDEGDQSGAFRTLARQPFGRVILVVVIVGLAAMAIWQLLEAAIGHHDEHGASRTAERVASVARAIVYALLAFTAGKVVAGAPSSNASQQQNTTAGVLAHPAGRWLIALAGLAVVAIGVGLLVYGAKKKFERRLKIGQMSRQTRQIAVRLGQFGYIAKGVAFGIAGILLASAALKRDAQESRGLDAALRSLVGKPYGTVLLIVIAIGFAAFGVYCFFQSKYRKV
jgi:hypothetical protein